MNMRDLLGWSEWCNESLYWPALRVCRAWPPAELSLLAYDGGRLAELR